MMLVWLLACGSTPTPAIDGSLDVEAWAVERTASGGVLVVVARSATSELDLPVPEVEGLTFSPDGTPRSEQIGGQTVVTQRWRYTGKKGSYEIPALTVSSGDEEDQSAPFWVDLGVEAPSVGELSDIVEPSPLSEIPWGWITAAAVTGMALLGMMAGGMLWLFRPRPRPEMVVPADVRALDEWERVLENPDLSNEDKATELSRIFREYTESVLAFPAAAWTTTEILAHLEALQHLEKGNLPRAKRLLRATDRVKYAEDRPTAGFFDDLDSDLRAFVSSTRPRIWSAEGE